MRVVPASGRPRPFQRGCGHRADLVLTSWAVRTCSHLARVEAGKTLPRGDVKAPAERHDGAHSGGRLRRLPAGFLSSSSLRGAVIRVVRWLEQGISNLSALYQGHEGRPGAGADSHRPGSPVLGVPDRDHTVRDGEVDGGFHAVAAVVAVGGREPAGSVVRCHGVPFRS